MKDLSVHVINSSELSNKEILTRVEAAAYLGYSLGYLNKLCCQKAIPYYKPTRKTSFFKRSELDEWMLQGKVEKK